MSTELITDIYTDNSLSESSTKNSQSYISDYSFLINLYPEILTIDPYECIFDPYENGSSTTCNRLRSTNTRPEFIQLVCNFNKRNAQHNSTFYPILALTGLKSSTICNSWPELKKGLDMLSNPLYPGSLTIAPHECIFAPNKNGSSATCKQLSITGTLPEFVQLVCDFNRRNAQFNSTFYPILALAGLADSTICKKTFTKFHENPSEPLNINLYRRVLSLALIFVGWVIMIIFTCSYAFTCKRRNGNNDKVNVEHNILNNIWLLLFLEFSILISMALSIYSFVYTYQEKLKLGIYPIVIALIIKSLEFASMTFLTILNCKFM